MKTISKNNGIIKIAAAMLLSLLFGLSMQAQAATSPAAFSGAFDHTQTGFILKDVHLTLRCEQCHVDGIFKNTPKNCAGCHAIGTRVGATPQPINHVQTTAACDTCHTSTANFQVKSFNHMSVTGNCSSCHNSQSLGVMSKSASNHIPTLQPCELCHTNTSTFASWQMGNTGHTGITSNCFACHGGPAGEPGVVGTYPNVVSYNPATHITITTSSGLTPDCNACHSNFNTFLGATFNHANVSLNVGGNSTPLCSSCHSGQTIGVKAVPPIPANHITIPAGNDCSVCHSSTTTFLGALYSHAGVATGTCENCHTGAYPGVMTKGTNHIPTLSYKCDSCHTSLNTVAYTTFSGSSYHGSVLTPSACNTCHTGYYAAPPESALGPTSGNSGFHIPISSSQSCDLCHTQANTNSYIAFSGAVYHTSVVPAGTCSSCHTSAGTVNPPWNISGFNAVPTHIPVGSLTCDQCHTASNTTQYTSFLGTTYHGSVTSPDTCTNCHTSAGTFSGAPWNAQGQNFNTTHFPIGTLTCNTCHTAANTLQYTTFLGATYHASVSTPDTCTNCHVAAYINAPWNALQPINNSTIATSSHVQPWTSLVCSTCHTQSNTVNFTTFYGATFDHSTVTTLHVCSTCHDNAKAKGMSSSHITVVIPTAPSTSDCDSCHIDTANFTTFANGSFHPNGSLVGKTCGQGGGCHDGNSAGAPNYALGKPADHPTTSVTTCDSINGCHTNTKNYSTWSGTQFHPSGAAANNCASSYCHGGTAHTTWGTSPAISLPIAAQHPTTSITQCDTAGGCHVNSSFVAWSGTMFHPAGAAAGSCGTTNCHTGTLWGSGLTKALSTPTGHPPTGSIAINSCDSAGGCHTTVAPSYSNWAGTMYHPAGAVNVNNATTGCGQSNCHTGTLWGTAESTSYISNHVSIGSTTACDSCHTTSAPAYTTWLGAIYTHTSTANGVCQNCHDGTQAHGQSTPHITASGTCDASGCHSPAANLYTTANLNLGYPAAWAINTYNHPGITVGGSTACSTCHGTTTAIYPNVSTQSNCYSGTACQTPGAFTHQTTSAKCDSCHTSLTTWTGAGYTHTTADNGKCATSSCHGAGGAGKGVSTNHIPVTMSCDLGGCHKIYGGSVTSFVGGIWIHGATNTQYATARCDSCHGVYPTFGTFGALGKVSNHIPITMAAAAPSSTGVGDCNACHMSSSSMPPTGAATAGATAWATETVGVAQHGNGVYTGGGTGGIYCVTCHLKGATYLAPNIQQSSHNKASTALDCSSAKCHMPLGSKGTSYTKWNN